MLRINEAEIHPALAMKRFGFRQGLIIGLKKNPGKNNLNHRCKIVVANIYSHKCCMSTRQVSFPALAKKNTNTNQ